MAWAREHGRMPGLTLRALHSAELVDAGERFDLVISNHLLHHLQPAELHGLLRDSLHLLASGGLALHRDIARGRLAYVGFALATAPLPSTHRRRSFIRADGLTSIRRSYRRGELTEVVPAGWTVRSAFPARLELRRERTDD
ncbi:methyltransferase domain-containing protein [Microbacterium sp. NIBRBAC000506063]|uniref:methyltransferase domain-containing protein n=1 Tax=Microbacterium sp. NIBRBAC000506063 TaxID=2734618 RepID=UPI002948BD21|nr:methyltransferase domain-containing protein [Microbacterium sp. NIBRBAC000506063]